MSDEQPVMTKQSGKLIIGLTGNISTGKSAIMRLAAEHNALLIDTDKVVHELMDGDGELQEAIVATFGDNMRRENGRINRHTLAELVFQDANALRQLEALVHPRVQRIVTRRINESEAAVVMIEAIKLLEGSLAGYCHQIWVTRCSRQRQLERLVVCRGMDADTAKTRIMAQPAQEEKVALADVVIETDGLMKDTVAQFELYWGRLPDPNDVVAKALPIYPETAPIATATPAPATTTTAAKPKPKLERLKGASAKLAAKRSRALKQAKTGTADTPAEPKTTVNVVPMVDLPPDTSDSIPIPDTIPDGVESRRARPPDIPSILLLIHKATNGALRLKRADLLMAFSERSYFIGQVGTQITTVIGWNIENQVSRLEEIYMHPLADAIGTGKAVLAEIEKSAKAHICEVMVAFLSESSPVAIRKLFEAHGYEQQELDSLERGWRRAVAETMPEHAQLMVKVLQERN